MKCDVKMRVIHISSFDWMGGAAKAASRLHRSLRSLGVDSQMLVDVKESKDPNVHSLSGFVGFASRLCYYIRGRVDQRPLRKYSCDGSPWIVSRTKRNILKNISKYNPDVVHIHWVSASASLKELADLPVPTVWSMHDIGLATGGCCYPGTCERYVSGCGCCPKLDSNNEDDFSHILYRDRCDIFSKCSHRFVALSEWQRNVVQRSQIMKRNSVQVIHNGVDVVKFKPLDMVKSRRALSLPLGRPLIAFGAESLDNPLKGKDVLLESLNMLKSESPEASSPVLVTFGCSSSRIMEECSLDVIELGYLSSDKLAQLFSAVDVVVVPSLEDNCPQVPLEAQACGAPVVGFELTGVAELINDLFSGMVVGFNDSIALKNGIVKVLSQSAELRVNARNHVLKNFDISVVTNKYIDLYQQVIVAGH